MPPVLLQFAEHSIRLTAITWATRYALGAVREKEERSGGDKEMAQHFSTIREVIQRAKERPLPRAGPGEPFAQVEAMLGLLEKAAFAGRRASELLLSLGLVMLCTELELFINHVLDTVLTAEPRRFMDLFPEKQVSAREAVEAADYQGVMRRLRDKVVDEVDRQGTREKFLTHLGSRFGLIDESQISPLLSTGGASGASKGSGIDMLEKIFTLRHRIVHRGELPVKDLELLTKVAGFFGAIEARLAINAVRKYDLQVGDDSRMLAIEWGELLGVPPAHLDEFKQKVLGGPPVP